MNILATYHPTDKNYGHQKIDEPPTPYNKDYQTEKDKGHGVDPRDLAAKYLVIIVEHLEINYFTDTKDCQFHLLIT
jgi:hypothetical protein